MQETNRNEANLKRLGGKEEKSSHRRTSTADMAASVRDRLGLVVRLAFFRHAAPAQEQVGRVNNYGG